MAAPKRKPAAKKPAARQAPVDAQSIDWEQEARRLSIENQQLVAANKALRGQLVGFGQMLSGVVKSIFGDEGQPPRPAN